LTPWRGVFKPDTIQKMVSESVSARLARALAKWVDRSQDTSQWNPLDSAFEMSTQGLLSTRELLSLIEGEVLSRWAALMYDKVMEGSSLNALAETYGTFKLLLLKSPETLDDSSYLLVRNDEYICRYFFAVVQMIAAASDGTGSGALESLCPSDTNYRAVLARRASDDKKRAAEDLLRMESGVVGKVSGGVEARVRLQRQGHVPTFREVVEEFAREKDIMFQPRTGGRATVDGKQTFLFGKTPIYLDANVVFAMGMSAEWRPVSLDELGAKEKTI
jgi:hypothetical protein